MTEDQLVDAIDELLPQTQCGLCGYGGCRPYAEALAKKQAHINLCPPGGTTTLMALADLLNENPQSFVDDMKKNERPPRVAVIREAECIGCTICIQACPVDAILGAAKQMHTVFATECTGCELCIEPCPVDCIDIVLIDAPNEKDKKKKSMHARQRYHARNKRIQALASEKKKMAQQRSREEQVELRKKELQEAIARAKERRRNNDA